MHISRDRLAKLLALSTSDHVGEALESVRAANRMVQAAGLTWHDVLAGCVVGRSVPTEDQAIYTNAYGTVLPPIGATWADTVRRLCAEGAGANPYENALMMHIAGRLARGVALAPNEAVFVISTYHAWTKQEAQS